MNYTIDNNPCHSFKAFQRLFMVKGLALFFLIGTFNSFVFANNEQAGGISLNVQNVELKKVLFEIEEKSDFYFTYNLNQFNAQQKFTLKVEDKQIDEVLDILFMKRDVKYKISGKNIVLYKTGNNSEKENISNAQPVNKIKGTVTDKNGEPVIGASVIVKGGDKQTATDVSGNFEIEASPTTTLVISFIGFLTQEVQVGANTSLMITLNSDLKSLEEVVVVGYGTQKKENVTSAISSIQAKDITTTTNVSLAQSLQGKIPGLQIRQQNSEPGAFSSSINIRGFGEPLYVIDGIVRDGRVEFQQLNPNDIESISVLKDASAAIYGLNAANGVILITTKKGISGKPTFSYSGVVGFQTPTDVPRMASASQYLEMYDDAIFYRDGTHSITKDELNKWRAGGPGYESTNWYDETMKKSAMQQQHDFSVRGGSDKVNYFVSLGNYNEGGLFKSNDINYNRYNFRSNLSVKLVENLTADVMLSGRYGKREYPGGDGFIWIYKGTIISHPNERPFINDDPNYPANIYIQQNPVLMSQSKYAGYTHNEDKSFQSSAALTYDVPFLEGLEAKATVAYDSYNMFNKNVWKNYKVYSPDLTPQVINPPRIANAIDNANRLVFQGQLTYNQSIADAHNIDATVVFEQKRYNKKYAFLKREYEFFTTDIVDYASGLQTNEGREEEEANMSYIGRFNYNYRGKYMVGYSFRYDGSYRYAPDDRWAFFPAVSAGWRISEEGFFKDHVSFVNNLKLRGSYGSIGENAGSPFQHVLGFSPKKIVDGREVPLNQGAEFENGNYTGGLAAPGVINPNFTWVKSTIQDVGIEASILNNLFTFEADYYQREKTGMLKTREGGLPNTFGGDMPIENLESELTKGFDFIVSHRNKINDFDYGVSFNLNLARTMWKVVDKPAARSSFDNWRNGFIDRWNDREWGYNKTGQFQNYEEIINGAIQGGDRGNSLILPGDYVYEDVNGDGIINDLDIQPIFRNRNPKLFYGFTLTAAWKNFDLNTVFQGASLYTVRFNEVFSQMFFNDGNLPAYFYDRWHLADSYDPNSEWVPGKWPANRFSEEMPSNYHESSAWRMNASYLRMKSIELGYTIPADIAKKIKLDNVRIYANAHNLLTFADSFLKQFDPERFEGDYHAGYNYPLTKSFNFGVNVSF